jgi:hypothetical protein
MIPWRTTFTIPLSPDEAVARLEAVTDPAYNRWFPVAWRHKTPAGHYYRFGGKVHRENRKFRLVTDPNITGKGSYHFTYLGRIEMGLAETIVTVWVRAPLPSFLIPILILALIGKEAQRVLVFPWNIETTKMVIVAVVATAALIGWSISEARYAKSQLLEVFASSPDPQDRIPL